MSERIDWNGGDLPVHPMTIVHPTYRGPTDPEKGIRIDWPCCAGRLCWYHDGEDDDIVAYRIIQSAAAPKRKEGEGNG